MIVGIFMIPVLLFKRAKKSKLLRETDVDVENKKFNLTVIAPDFAEDGTFADVCDMGRSNPADN